MKSKVALVTGALGHLGKVICNTLTELDYIIIATDFLPDDSSTSKFVENLKEGSLFINSNLSSDDSRIELVRRIQKNFSSIDLLVNNAAYTSSSTLDKWNVPFNQQSTNSWRNSLEVNLIAPFHLTQLCELLLKTSADGAIINIGSIYGIAAPKNEIYNGTDMNNIAAYAAGKAGLIQLTKWLASTLAPNIRVNSISLGGIERSNQEPIFVLNYSNRTPLKRMGKEEDIIGVLTLFAGDDARYITGQNIVIDGGWTL